MSRDIAENAEVKRGGTPRNVEGNEERREKLECLLRGLVRGRPRVTRWK